MIEKRLDVCTEKELDEILNDGNGDSLFYRILKEKGVLSKYVVTGEKDENSPVFFLYFYKILQIRYQTKMY